MRITFDECDCDSWTEWAGDAPLEQHWAYGATAQRLGARIVRARLGPPSDPVGIAQGVVRRIGPLRVLWLPRGVFPRHGGELGHEAAAATGAALPGLVAILSPGATVPLSAPRMRAIVGLHGDLRAGLGGKWRNALRRAERSDLAVERVAGCPAWLRQGEAEQRRARGYRALPPEWLAAFRLAAPDAVESWIARRGAHPVAGMSFLRHGRGMTYHLGWSGRAGRARNAHNLLLWHAMNDAAARGTTMLDLGLVDPARLPGLTRFKRGARARLVHDPAVGLVLPRRAAVQRGARGAFLPALPME
ncbi:GNAT family N-acetyltransferase [Palleronia sediminis]|uniref:GNAT family N-acetyltransferase n=1 Tax=Palleronia sediminis TaxID=2547833 RepID=A0A4R6AHK8_9RHOB|nr:GNAT family N-acetyltransferase [Palleronia sediminis]TDL83691.1 GNAT family N-acetyltransferase [Palleronia sediminis]